MRAFVTKTPYRCGSARASGRRPCSRGSPGLPQGLTPQRQTLRPCSVVPSLPGLFPGGAQTSPRSPGSRTGRVTRQWRTRPCPHPRVAFHRSRAALAPRWRLFDVQSPSPPDAPIHTSIVASRLYYLPGAPKMPTHQDQTVHEGRLGFAITHRNLHRELPRWAPPLRQP